MPGGRHLKFTFSGHSVGGGEHSLLMNMELQQSSEVGHPLEDYVATRSDDAFRAFVEAYLDMVYSACRRQLHDDHLAEDATQAVFLLLSQKASKLPGDRLAGWLLTASRYACANIQRSEQRRKRRERMVAMDQEQSAAKSGTSSDLPMLDNLDRALATLSPGDREAVVLRFLHEQNFTRIAATLRLSEAAVRKRISRAMEKLRLYFHRRGITSDANLLGVFLSDQLSGSRLSGPARKTLTQSIVHLHHAGAAAASPAAAIARATRAGMTMQKLSVAAAIVVVAATTAGGSWIIYRAASERQVPLQAQTAPVSKPQASAGPVDAAPAAADKPATSLIDLSTPGKCLRSFFVTLSTGDRTASYACLTADPSRPTTVMDAMIAWNLAQNRLTRAALATFGDASGIQGVITLDSVAQFAGGGATPAQISGDTATITANIPQTVIDQAPPDFQPALQAWQGATFYFVNRSGQWHFDIDRSMRVEIKLQLDHNRRKTPALLTAIMLDNAAADDQLAADIGGGRLANLATARRAMSAAQDAIAKKRGILSMQFQVLPGAIDGVAVPATDP